jgi:hypothetical protein
MSGTSANKGFYAGCNPMVFKKAGPQPGLLDKSKAPVTPIKPACPSDSYEKVLLPACTPVRQGTALP